MTDLPHMSPQVKWLPFFVIFSLSDAELYAVLYLLFFLRSFRPGSQTQIVHMCTSPDFVRI